MPTFKGKTITDPLYGNIELSPVEAEIVSSPAFQRLHNVRQLGLGHLVFPSAGYSRFAHSIGAVVTTDRLIDAINRSSSRRKLTEVERQAFRLAALTHDLGHFPFSHTTEHASKSHYNQSWTGESQLAFAALDTGDVSAMGKFIDHEDTGKLVFRTDQMIREAFNGQTSVSSSNVEEAFLDPKLSNIISSDLDCDRLDYLKRTSHHSGAPYGAVDVDFIISKATLDDDGRFCFDRKALRAADHLLVSRFYDFLQIPYHKTVAALEWSLEEAVKILLRDGDLNLSEGGIFSLIGSGNWSSLDDACLLELIRNRIRTENFRNDIEVDHFKAVTERKAAKGVFFWEQLCPWDSDDHVRSGKELKKLMDLAATRFGFDRGRLNLWTAPFKLSKAGPLLQGAGRIGEGASDEEEAELIHILGKGESLAKPLIDMENAVSKHLNQTKYRVLRVYWLPPDGDDRQKADLRAYFAKEMAG